MTVEEIKDTQSQLHQLQGAAVSTEHKDQLLIVDAVLEVALQLAELRKDLTIRNVCDSIYLDRNGNVAGDLNDE